MTKVAIVMGSKSDYEVVKKAEEVLQIFNIEYESRIISAHRTPEEAFEFASSASDNGIDVIIAAAGKSAHLAGVMAAVSTLPIIGIPMQTHFMGGLDSLLSIVQMPNGVPVACVGVDGAVNAALLAVQMLSLKDKRLKQKLIEYKETMKNEVIKADDSIKK